MQDKKAKGRRKRLEVPTVFLFSVAANEQSSYANFSNWQHLRCASCKKVKEGHIAENWKNKLKERKSQFDVTTSLVLLLLPRWIEKKRETFHWLRSFSLFSSWFTLANSGKKSENQLLLLLEQPRQQQHPLLLLLKLLLITQVTPVNEMQFGVKKANQLICYHDLPLAGLFFLLLCFFCRKNCRFDLVNLFLIWSCLSKR